MNLKSMISFLVVCLTVIGCGTFAFALNDFSVEVKSVYKNKLGHLSPIRGSGVHVAFKYKKSQILHFILTAAHVSQGADLRIKLNGKPVKVLSRVSDSRSDLELIQIEDPRSSPWAMGLLEQGLLYNQFFKVGQEVRSSFGPEKFYAFQVGNDLGELVGNRSATAPFVISPLNLKNQKAKAYDDSTFGRLIRTSFLNLSDQFVFRSQIAPGMSGSGLFSQISETGKLGAPLHLLTGVVIQYSRLEKISYAASFLQIQELVKHFVLGVRGEIVRDFAGVKTKVQWFHDGKMTVRKLIDITTGEVIAVENASSVKLAGDGTNGDGGDGTNGDGGDGTNGDGGDGTNGDGGDGTNGDGGDGTNGDGGDGTNGDGGDGTNGDGGDGTNGDGGDGRKSKVSQSAGIVFSGKTIQYFLVTDKFNNSVFLTANWSALKLIMDLGSSFQVVGMNSGDLTKQHYFQLICKRRFPKAGQDRYSMNLIFSKACDQGQQSLQLIIDIYSLGDAKGIDRLVLDLKAHSVKDNYVIRSDRQAKRYSISLSDLVSSNVQKIEATSVVDKPLTAVQKWNKLLINSGGPQIRTLD